MSVNLEANPDIVRWNEKYRQAEPQSYPIVPKGEPELVNCASSIAPESGQLALEVACGRGANALYLAKLGYEVVAVDGSVEGMRICERNANSLDLPVYPVVADLNTMVLPKSSFSFISVVRYLNRGLVPRLIEALEPGGLIFYKTFSHHFLKTKPNFNPDYVLRENELFDWFCDLQILATNADQQDSTTYMLAKR